MKSLMFCLGLTVLSQANAQAPVKKDWWTCNTGILEPLKISVYRNAIGPFEFTLFHDSNQEDYGLHLSISGKFRSELSVPTISSVAQVTNELSLGANGNILVALNSYVETGAPNYAAFHIGLSPVGNLSETMTVTVRESHSYWSGSAQCERAN